jgi:hypothetical protein
MSPPICVLTQIIYHDFKGAPKYYFSLALKQDSCGATENPNYCSFSKIKANKANNLR